MRASWLAIVLSIIGFSAPASAQSAWRYERDKDDLTDRATVHLSTQATAALAANHGTVRPSFHVRCNDGDLDIYLNAGTTVGSDDVEFRFDEGEVQPLSMIGSTDHDALFLFSSGTPRPAEFLKAMAAGSRLRVRFLPIFTVPVTAQFSLVGLSALLPRLNEAGCDAKELMQSSGFVAPDAAAAWVGDPAKKEGYPLKCGSGQYLVTVAQMRNEKARYFPTREAVVAAGYKPVESPCL